MKRYPGIVVAAAVVLFAATSHLLADARSDVTVRTETDDKRNTIYYLVNAGQKTVRAKVELEKRCTSIANNQKPEVREYTLSAGEKRQIGKAWERTTCRRTYRILEATYPYDN
jgi:hypothetical protein